MSFPHLDFWADRLADALDRSDSGASLVGLGRSEGSSTDVVVAIKPLDGHPAEVLAAFRAPDSWAALGLVTGGWIAPADGHQPPSSHPEARRIVQVVLVDRSGDIESRVLLPDGAVLREAPTEGIVLDALRAAIGARPPGAGS